MANLTITVDPDTLKRARLRAVERGESVNQYLAEHLREYAFASDKHDRRQRAAERFVELSRELAGNSGGEAWTRDELHSERIERRSMHYVNRSA